VGDRVNTERALKIGDRMGGHFVAGHVDAMGTIRAKDEGREQVTVTVAVHPTLTRYMAPKGSVAVDGISLTLVDVGRDFFSVALIPYTLGETTLGTKRAGEPVNVEVDILARYVERMMGGQSGLTEESLRQHGFC
jgi:riboflavin synthase